MQKLNLIHLENSDIKYNIFKFPDGEIQISLGEFSRKDSVLVKCRITNSDELFILTQVMDILDRQDVRYVINIYYLMGMRMDRVMDFNRPFTLKIILQILANSNAEEIGILEAHSDVVYDYRFGRKIVSPLPTPYIYEFSDLNVEGKYQIVLPDAGAKERYECYFAEPIIICSKVREESTGKILEIKIDNPKDLNGSPLMLVDDLCDGGGTFCGIAECFRKIGISKDKLNITVTHMVNSKGIENLSKNFNHVWFTNSYKDWENLPENVTMTKII